MLLLFNIDIISVAEIIAITGILCLTIYEIKSWGTPFIKPQIECLWVLSTTKKCCLHYYIIKNDKLHCISLSTIIKVIEFNCCEEIIIVTLYELEYH